MHDSKEKSKPVELTNADAAALFLLVSLPWAFMLARARYGWDLEGFGTLIFLALFMLRNSVLFPQAGHRTRTVVTWKTGVVLLTCLVLLVGLAWISTYIERAVLAFFLTLLIALFLARDIWLASLKTKGQLPANETLFPRREMARSH